MNTVQEDDTRRLGTHHGRADGKEDRGLPVQLLAENRLPVLRARRVIHGYVQEPGMNYGVAFAPVCRRRSQRMLLVIAWEHVWGRLPAKCASRVSPR